MRFASLRRAAAETGLSRHFLGQLVRMGALPARRHGRSIVVAIEDIDRWWRANSGPIASDDAAFVTRRLEERRASP